MYRHFFKRLIDTCLALCGLVVCCVPMVIIAIAIKLDSKGPVLFKQVRLGKGMKPITVFKFRTMCDHAYEMGGEFSAEQIGIAAGKDKVNALAQQTVDKQMPGGDVLNFIHKQMCKSSVYAI